MSTNTTQDAARGKITSPITMENGTQIYFKDWG
jgi:hypothetical protein